MHAWCRAGGGSVLGMGTELALTLLAAVALAGVQILPRFVPTLEGPRQQAALSAAGGFSAAFVFLELLPQVLERDLAVANRTQDLLPFVDEEVLFLALVGLITFYGLETLARSTRPRGLAAADDPAGLVQITAFAGYYGLIGYLLWTQVVLGAAELVAFAVPVGVHFLVVDYGLRAHHPNAYRRVGRWVLALMVLLGWAVGAIVAVPEGFVGIGIAFLAGGVMLITLKEELPEEAEGRFLWFSAGAVAYTALIAVL
jgi:hypothetical protein